MFRDEPETPPPDERRTLAWAVATAALTTLATGLVDWAVDELRARYGSKDGKGNGDAPPR